MLNVLSRVEMSICLLLELAGDVRERENVLFRVDWSVLLLARRKQKEIEGAMHSLFMLPREGDPGRMASVILIRWNI